MRLSIRFNVFQPVTQQLRRLTAGVTRFSGQWRWLLRRRSQRNELPPWLERSLPPPMPLDAGRTMEIPRLGSLTSSEATSTMEDGQNG